MNELDKAFIDIRTEAAKLKTHKFLLCCVIVGLIAIILIILDIHRNTNKRLEQVNAMYKVSQDSLTITKNSKGVLEAKIAVFTSDKEKDFINLQTKDKAILDLQNQVKYYKSILVAGSSVTNATIVTKTDTMFIDNGTLLVTKDSIVTMNVDLDRLFHGWITGHISATKDLYNNLTSKDDTTKVSISVLNKFTIVVAKDKGKPVAILTDENPYTNTVGLRSYQVSMPKNHWVRNMVIGCVIGIVTERILFK